MEVTSARASAVADRSQVAGGAARPRPAARVPASTRPTRTRGHRRHRAGHQPGQARRTAARCCCAREPARRAKSRCSRSTAAPASPTSTRQPARRLLDGRARRAPGSAPSGGWPTTSTSTRSPAPARRCSRVCGGGPRSRRASQPLRGRRCRGAACPARPCAATPGRHRRPTAARVIVRGRRRARPRARMRRRRPTAAVDVLCRAAARHAAGRRCGRMHEALRHTRGAAGGRGSARSARRGRDRSPASATSPRPIVAHGDDRARRCRINGIARPRGRGTFHEYQYPWPRSAAGDALRRLTTHWTLDAYPGLRQRHPALDRRACCIATSARPRRRHGRGGQGGAHEHAACFVWRSPTSTTWSLARQRARQIAALLGFDARTRRASPPRCRRSRATRSCYAGGGRVEFAVEGSRAPQVLTIRVSDSGPRHRRPRRRSWRGRYTLDHRHGPRHHRRAPADGRVRHRRRSRHGHDRHA